MTEKKELKKITKTSENVFHTLSSFFESRSILDQKRFSQDKENKLFNDYTQEYGVKRTFRLKSCVGNFNDFFDELITGRLRKLYLRHDTPNIGVAIPGIPKTRPRKDTKRKLRI